MVSARCGISHRAAWNGSVVGLILGQVLLLSYLLPLDRTPVLLVGLGGAGF